MKRRILAFGLFLMLAYWFTPIESQASFFKSFEAHSGTIQIPKGKDRRLKVTNRKGKLKAKVKYKKIAQVSVKKNSVYIKAKEVGSTSLMVLGKNFRKQYKLTVVPEKFQERSPGTCTYNTWEKRLSWDYVVGGGGYEIYERTEEGKIKLTKVINDPFRLEFVDKRAKVGSEKRYMVRAIKRVKGKKIFSAWNVNLIIAQ